MTFSQPLQVPWNFSEIFQLLNFPLCLTNPALSSNARYGFNILLQSDPFCNNSNMHYNNIYFFFNDISKNLVNVLTTWKATDYRTFTIGYISAEYLAINVVNNNSSTPFPSCNKYPHYNRKIIIKNFVFLYFSLYLASQSLQILSFKFLLKIGSQEMQ